jgi:TP901-1 family phage major tail protein
MPAQNGSAFLLKIGNGASPPTYQTVAGLRTTQMTINGDSIVVTHKGSGGWRDLLSGAGTRSVSVSAAGIFLGSSAETTVRGHALAGTLSTITNCRSRMANGCAGDFWCSGSIMRAISTASVATRSSSKAPGR